jgi:hypothetical protein
MVKGTSEDRSRFLSIFLTTQGEARQSNELEPGGDYGNAAGRKIVPGGRRGGVSDSGIPNKFAARSGNRLLISLYSLTEVHIPACWP